MKLTTILFAALFLISCNEIIPNKDSTEKGSLNLNITVGAVGRQISRINLSSYTILLTAAGEDTIVEEGNLTTSSTILITKSFSELTANKEWTVEISTSCSTGSTVHYAKETFTLSNGETIELDINMPAKFSVLYANFFPIKDSVTKCEVVIDEEVCVDSTFQVQDHVDDTISVSWDYVSASPTGENHNISLNVYGIMWGENYLLYTADTTISVISGEKVNCNMTLKWVGPNEKPNGSAEINVTIGNIDTVFINGELKKDDDLTTEDGLVAYYPLNGNTNDMSGSNNHGQAVGGWFTTDRFGNIDCAYEFDGIYPESYIEVIEPSNLPSGNIPRSLCGWFLMGSACGYTKDCDLGGFGVAISGKNFQFGTNAAFDDITVWGWTSSYDWYSGSPATQINDSEWHFVVTQFDGVNTEVYLDNIKILTTQSYDWNTDPRLIILGNEIDRAGHEIMGKIDDVRIYNRTLSKEEIAILYSMQ